MELKKLSTKPEGPPNTVICSCGAAWPADESPKHSLFRCVLGLDWGKDIGTKKTIY